MEGPEQVNAKSCRSCKYLNQVESDRIFGKHEECGHPDLKVKKLIILEDDPNIAGITYPTPKKCPFLE